MRAIAAIAVIVGLAAPVPAWAELNMRPGMWETIMTVGGNQMPPDRKCYLQKDIDALDRFQRGAEPQGKSPCATSAYQEIGNTMSYSLVCVINGQKTISAVTMNYDRDRITGEISPLNGPVSSLINTRTGDCTESSFPNQ
jgi:uncharacterized protein DUF3617